MSRMGSTTVKQARADRTKGKTGLTKRAELARLRKDNRELRMERDVLKKATAFFAKDHSRSSAAGSNKALRQPQTGRAPDAERRAEGAAAQAVQAHHDE